MTEIEFRVLGPVKLLIDGASVDCGGLKQRTLLAALLAQADRVVAVDHLVEAIWPSGPPTTAPNTLQVYVSGLRRCLGGERSRLQTRAPGYVLRASDALDSARFESAARHGREELAAGDAVGARKVLSAALDLWRGAAFADFLYEEFTQREAERLEALRLAVTADHIDSRLALGQHRELVAELESLVNGRPTDERLCGQLMLSLYRSGRQADALKAYGLLRQTLGEELGIIPGLTLQALHDQIVLQSPELEPPLGATTDQKALTAVGHSPPVALTSFVGRDAERSAVAARLDHARLVTISGPGGSGKTRLAVEVATSAARDRRVRFVDLAPLDPSGSVLAAVAEAIGVSDPQGMSAEELSGAVSGVLAAHSRFLLVVDNCEHVVEECAALVHRLLAQVPELKILATSQVPLGVGGESLVPLGPLGLPENDDPHAASASEAVQLFAARASDYDPAFALSSETAPVVAHICRQLDGMPLAIELAAAQARTFGLAEISARLDDALGFLATGPRTAAERHRTLRAAVDWSVQLLDEAERELLERLAVFTDGFALTRAERVCAGDGIAEAQVASLLARLVDRSLVIRRSRGGTDRYWLLETIRQYGWQQLSAQSSR